VANDELNIDVVKYTDARANWKRGVMCMSRYDRNLIALSILPGVAYVVGLFLVFFLNPDLLGHSPWLVMLLTVLVTAVPPALANFLRVRRRR
jgi:hypothetical protein